VLSLWLTHRWRWLLVCALISSPALAADTTASQSAVDTIWLAISAGLVFFMQAGFALLEGGMARSKNAVNVLMKNYMDVCVGGILFWLVGFGLMFGNNPAVGLAPAISPCPARPLGIGLSCCFR